MVFQGYYLDPPIDLDVPQNSFSDQNLFYNHVSDNQTPGPFQHIHAQYLSYWEIQPCEYSESKRLPKLSWCRQTSAQKTPPSTKKLNTYIQTENANVGLSPALVNVLAQRLGKMVIDQNVYIYIFMYLE